MGEYEDRYPEAYGNGEETEPRKRHFLGLGLPRQMRGGLPAEEPAQRAAPAAEGPARSAKADPARTPREPCDDVWEQLNQSPFIDASRVTVTVDGGQVALDGAINSLIAISLAQALAAGVAGVDRVQVRLRVEQPARRRQT